MKKPLLAALTLVLLVSACGSRLNPLNWFRRSAPVAVTEQTGVPQDPRALVDQVLTMTVEPMKGGAIVRATGLPPTQGWWDAELVARPLDADGKLTYDFRIKPPVQPMAAVTPFSRQVTAAAVLSDYKLVTIREIIVQGAQNARASRR